MPSIDHIAFVVEKIEKLVDEWLVETDNLIEDFPSEGTRELYLGAPEQSMRILLMQPTGPGPYENAYQKRGDSLHHIAFCVDDINAIAKGAQKVGWERPPKSLPYLESMGQLWLCKPGIPTLIEIVQGRANYDSQFAEKLYLPITEFEMRLFDIFECQNIEQTNHSFPFINLNGQEIALQNLKGP